MTGHFVSLWLSKQTGDGASYRLIYSLGVFLTLTSPGRARLNYGRDADAVKPPERFLPGGEAALGSHPGAPGAREQGQHSSPPLKCAWHPGGPSRGLGWTVGGQDWGAWVNRAVLTFLCPQPQPHLNPPSSPRRGAGVVGVKGGVRALLSR